MTDAPGAPARTRRSGARDGASSTARGLRIAFAGGGTGGHVVPGVHLLQHVSGRSPLAAVLWFGVGRRAENRALRGVERAFGRRTLGSGTSFTKIDLPLERPGGGAPRTPELLLRTRPAARRARAVMARERPDVVCGLGGFAVLPVVLAARGLGVPVALLEVNASAGRATRWLAPFADRVLHAWGSSVPDRPGARHVAIGPPLGPAFVAPPRGAAERRAAKSALGLDPDRPLLLVLGGSQGALALNRFARERADELLAAGCTVLHQVGPGRAGEAGERRGEYVAVEFVDDVAGALRTADLVLTRGGASTLAEIAAAGTPAVVVPYPHHADGHQRRNALAVGPGLRVVEESDGADAIAAELVALVRSPEERERRSRALRAAVPTDGAERLFEELTLLSASAVSQDRPA